MLSHAFKFHLISLLIPALSVMLWDVSLNRHTLAFFGCWYLILGSRTLLIWFYLHNFQIDRSINQIHLKRLNGDTKTLRLEDIKKVVRFWLGNTARMLKTNEGSYLVFVFLEKDRKKIDKLKGYK
jgi:hypothetical protein